MFSFIARQLLLRIGSFSITGFFAFKIGLCFSGQSSESKQTKSRICKIKYFQSFNERMAKLSPVKVKKEPDEPSTVVKVKQKAASKTKKSKFPCDQCKKILSSAAHLKKHNNTTHRLRDYVCDYDGKHFNTKDKLRLHIYIHRKHFRVHCEVCSKEYTTNQSMRKHLRTHFEHHQCDACGKTFKHKRLLLNHVSAIHSDDPTISCKCKLIEASIEA